MDPETEKIIKNQMEKLPIEIKRLFINSELNNKINNIGKKNGLNEEQLEVLQTEINLVMLGLVHPDDLGDELEENLKIDDVKLDNITNDTKTQIFRDIQEKLIESYEKTNQEKPDIEMGWRQNLDFILSGGDYSVLIEQRNTSTESIIPPTLADIQKNIQKTNTTSYKKMEDLKSKFVI